MTTNYLKAEVEPTPKMLHISNIPQTINNVQHSVPVTSPIIFRNHVLIRPATWLIRYYSSESATSH